MAARLAGVDLARALALLGMVSVHVFPSTQDDGATSVPVRLVASVHVDTDDDADPDDDLAWYATQEIPDLLAGR